MPAIIAAWFVFVSCVGVAKYRLEKRDVKIAALKTELGRPLTYEENQAVKDLAPRVRKTNTK